MGYTKKRPADGAGRFIIYRQDDEPYNQAERPNLKEPSMLTNNMRLSQEPATPNVGHLALYGERP